LRLRYRPLEQERQLVKEVQLPQGETQLLHTIV
jgi:hypothetical protein